MVCAKLHKLSSVVFLAALLAAGFWFLPATASAAYETVGVIVSTNLLPASGSEIINSFTYTITIPSGSAAYVLFSSNNLLWYDASGTANGLTALSTGTNTIDLSARGWHGYLFYYKVMFTSDGTVTPSLDSITVNYLDFNGTYNTYATSGSFTSTNLLSGQYTAISIDNFNYTALSLPPNVTATAQFSTDNSAWYNSSGTLNGSNTLSAGTNTIDLSGLGWAGTSFYYKITLTSDGTYTPVIDQIILNYTYNPDSVAPTTTATAVSGGSSYTFGNWTGSDVVITLTCADNEGGTGCSTTKYCADTTNTCTPSTTYSSAFTISTTGVSYIRYYSTDTIPNTETTNSKTIKIDATAPTTSDSATSNGSSYTYGNWTPANVSITLTPADATSGVAWTKYCSDTADSCDPSTGTTYSSAVSISIEGTSYFRYASQDNAGNTQTTVSRTIKIDATAPTTSVSSSRDANAITSTLTCSDGSYSGCSATYYCIDTDNGCSPTTLYSSAVSYEINRRSYFRFYSADSVSNSETVHADRLDLLGGSGGWGEFRMPPLEPTPVVLPAVPVPAPTPVVPSSPQSVPTANGISTSSLISQIQEKIAFLRKQIASLLGSSSSPFSSGSALAGTPPTGGGAGGGIGKQPSGGPAGPGELGIGNSPSFPLTSDIAFFSEQLWQFGEAVKALGTSLLDNKAISKITSLKWSIPGLTKATIANRDKKVPPKFQQPLTVRDIVSEDKEYIPSDIVFLKSGRGTIDYVSSLSFDKATGKAKQKVFVLQAEAVNLVIKPGREAEKITGKLVRLKSVHSGSPIGYGTGGANGGPANSGAGNQVLANLTEDAPATSSPVDPEFFVHQRFAYGKGDGGVWIADIRVPGIEGEYELVTNIDYKDDDLPNREISVFMSVEPKGYVYLQSLDGQTRIKGAEVSLYLRDKKTNKFALWNGGISGQSNPFITDETGMYSFAVAPGEYYYTVKAKGYREWKSEVFQVVDRNLINYRAEVKKR